MIRGNMSDSEDETTEKYVKIVFVGDCSVGKSSIIRRFCYNEFTRNYNGTSGADFYRKHIILPESQNVILKITDVGGQELNGTMLDKYLFNCDIVILVYDITNTASFDIMADWMKTLSKYLKQSPPVNAIFGNKFIEKYTENVRFCIICNYLSKIMPALQSRCTRFRFAPLVPEQILPRLDYVIEQENVKATENGKRALLTLANGDMRKVLNVLQSTWLAFKNVNEDNVYTCVGHPLKKDVENVISWLLNENFKNSYNNIRQLQVIKGLALSDILTEIHKYVQRIEFPTEIMLNILNKLAEIEMRLLEGTSESLQLTALVSAFYEVKEISPPMETS